MASDAEKLIDAIPLDSFIERYVKLKRKGSNYWGLCPFHGENTPSFCVSPEKQIFKCFGCQEGGNVISFVMKYDRVSFPEALKILSDYSGIQLSHRPANSQAIEKKAKIKASKIDLIKFTSAKYQLNISEAIPKNYLHQRKISNETIKYFKLGYAPQSYRYLENELQKRAGDNNELYKQNLLDSEHLGLIGRNDNSTYNRFRGRLIFPIENLKGEEIAFGGRILEKNDNAGKYVNSPESDLFSKKKTLYHLYRAKDAIRKSGQVILVEGYFDVIGLVQANIQNVVAPLGTALTTEQARILKRYSDRIILFFDNDKAGLAASYKAFQICQAQGLMVKVFINEQHDEKIDPFDLSQKLTQFDLLAKLDSAKDEKSFILWYLFSQLYDITDLSEKRKAIQQFFEFLKTIKEEWLLTEYLTEAAKTLNAKPQALNNDFNSFNSGNLQSNSLQSTQKVYKGERSKPENLTKVPYDEKEIVGILLRFPELWQLEITSLEIDWQSNDAYLIFSFFHDRIQSGELWSWASLTSLSLQLPQSLQAKLSGIIIEMDQVFDKNLEFLTGKERKEGEYYDKQLKLLFINHKIKDITRNQQELQKILISSETVSDNEAEKLSIEIGVLMKEKQKYEKYKTTI